MLTVVYKLFYPRNDEKAGSILEKKLQPLVMFKQMQVISKAEEKEKNNIYRRWNGSCEVSPTQCNWLSWYLSEQREELRVWFSVLCLGFGSQSVPTPSAELLHFWCVVSSLPKEASWCRRDDVCLAFIFFVSRVHIWSSAMYSVHLTLWGVWWHYSLRLEYEFHVQRPALLVESFALVWKCKVNVKCCTSGLKAIYLQFS